MALSASAHFKEHVNLAEFNTMGIAARARFFSAIKSAIDLKAILGDDAVKQLPVLMLGGGSNILFVDDFNGVVIHNQIKRKEIVEETNEHVLFKVGAGENWHQLVLFCVENGWGGIENLSLIPGSAGAAPIQNIGAYGVELEEVFEQLEAMELSTGKIKTFKKAECRFGYRDSIFKNELKGKYAIISVTLRLQKNPEVNTSYKALSDNLQKKGITKPTIKDVSNAVIEIRESKLPDPAKIGNTGSFFKNPVITKKEFKRLKKSYSDVPGYPANDDVKVPAAWLIDQCGWKGERIGDAGVHNLQALVIVNYGNATGEEIWNLAIDIQQSVKQKFDVHLVPEVNVI